MLNLLTLVTTSISKGELICVFVADIAATLHINILKQISGNLTHDERIFKRVRKIAKSEY